MANLAENNIVIIPDAAPSDKLGLQVHWRLSGFIKKEVFNQALKEAKLDPSLFPAGIGHTTYLRRAIEQLHNNKRRNLVRRLGDNKAGFSLVHERAEALDLDLEVETDADPVDAHEIKLTAKLVKLPGSESPKLKITPFDHPDALALEQEFVRQQTLYHCGTDLSQWLTTKIIPYCNGLSGRDRGGFYYIPAGEDVQRFEKIMIALKNVSSYGIGNRLLNGFKIYTIPAVPVDSMVEAVMDSLIEETDKICEDLETKLKEEKTGHRGWITQQQRAAMQEKKIKKYAKLLNTEVGDLTARLQDLQSCMGVMQAKMEAKHLAEVEARRTAKSA